MGLISFSSKGNFEKTEKLLQKYLKMDIDTYLKEFGEQGVTALSEATPVDSGLTADSWYYEIERTSDQITIKWLNSNVVNDWCNVALMIQYGHATRNGGYVKGVDYINPALKSIFDDMAEKIWKEVNS